MACFSFKSLEGYTYEGDLEWVVMMMDVEWARKQRLCLVDVLNVMNSKSPPSTLFVSTSFGVFGFLLFFIFISIGGGMIRDGSMSRCYTI